MGVVLANEDVKAVEEDDEGEVDERDPGGVGLEGGFEDERVAVDALGREGFVELDVGNLNGAPGEEGGDSCCVVISVWKKGRNQGKGCDVLRFWNQVKALVAPPLPAER